MFSAHKKNEESHKNENNRLSFFPHHCGYSAFLLLLWRRLRAYKHIQYTRLARRVCELSLFEGKARFSSCSTFSLQLWLTQAKALRKGKSRRFGAASHSVFLFIDHWKIREEFLFIFSLYSLELTAAARKQLEVFLKRKMKNHPFFLLSSFLSALVSHFHNFDQKNAEHSKTGEEKRESWGCSFVVKNRSVPQMKND